MNARMGNFRAVLRANRHFASGTGWKQFFFALALVGG